MSSFKYTVWMVTEEDTVFVGQTDHGWNLGRVIGDLLAKPECVTVMVRTNERARIGMAQLRPQPPDSSQARVV